MEEVRLGGCYYINTNFSSLAGSFLIVYFISMALCGIPIFVLEVAVGQYLGEGGMTLVTITLLYTQSGVCC